MIDFTHRIPAAKSAFQPVKDDLKKSPKSAYTYFNNLFSNDGWTTVNLRMDWESEGPLSGNEFLDILWLQGKNVDEFFEKLCRGTAKLIVNGDRSSDDLLLKNLDGEVVRGKPFSDIRVLGLAAYTTPRMSSNEVEVTVYFTLAVR